MNCYDFVEQLAMKLWTCCVVWCYLVLVSVSLESVVTDWHCSAGCSEAADELFFKINGTEVIAGGRGRYARLRCGGLALDAAGLPRRAAVATPRLTLERCALPRTASLAAALRTLRVAGLQRLTIVLVPGERLPPAAFRGLPPGLALDVQVEESAAVEPHEDLLRDAMLDELRITRVPLPESALEHLPLGLRLLSLDATGMTSLPAPALRRLPRLSCLTLREPLLSGQLELAGTAVEELYVTAPLNGVSLGERVVNATVWGASGMTLQGAGGTLRRLALGRTRVPLPARWLAGLPALEELSVEYSELGDVAAEALVGARGLRRLSLRGCAVPRLPVGLLRGVPALLHLDLAYNNLTELPELPASLESLDVSHNALTGLTRALGAARGLVRLDASHNPLADTCGADDRPVVGNAVSTWARLYRLRRLALRSVGATRLCADWRLAPALDHLDLRDNRITQLDRVSLQWRRAGGAGVVDARGNHVATVLYTRQDYDALAQQDFPEQHTRLVLSPTLRCDCALYWCARAVRDYPRHAPALEPAVCAEPAQLAGRSLASLPLSALTCAVPDLRCGPGCACVWREDRLWADCQGRNLTRVDLADFSDDIQVVNLSSNALTAAPAALAALAARGVVLALSHNPLSCSCAERALLLRHSEQIVDWARLRCADGSVPAECSWRAVYVSAAVVAAALVLAAALLALLYALRQYLPRRLRDKLAALWRLAGEREARPYDVFVSHAHADWPHARDVAACVEASGFKACVHWRDWLPGANITASISESVRNSRRTVVLLSPDYVSSQWANAELNTAAAEPARLIPILLSPLPENAPEPIIALIKSKTYLQIGDPRFKEKLLHAIKPRSRWLPPAQHLGAPLDAPVRKAGPPPDCSTAPVG